MTTKIKSGVIGDNEVGLTQLNVSDGTNGQVLITDGAGTLSFSTISGYTDSDVETYLNTSEIYTDPTNNRVGIGETSPDDKLHIKTASGDTALRFENSAGNNSRLILDSSNNTIIEFNSTPRIVLDSNGNIGMGASP